MFLMILQVYYLHKVEFTQSRRFVCLSVCVQDYCKSNRPISLKRGVVIGPTSQN